MKKSFLKLVAVSSAALTLVSVAAPVVSASELPDYVQSTEWNLEKITNALSEIKTRNEDRPGLASNLKDKEAVEASAQSAYDDAVADRQAKESDLTDAQAAQAAAKTEAHNAAVHLRDTLDAQKVDVEAITNHYNEVLEGERTTRKAEATSAKKVLAENKANTEAEANRLFALIPADPGVADDGTADYTERKAAYDAAVAAYEAAQATADTAAAENAAYDLAAVHQSIDADVDAKVAAAADRVSNYYEHDGEYFEDLNGVLTQAIKRDSDAKAALASADEKVVEAQSALETARGVENTAAANLVAAREAARKAKVAYSSNESAIRDLYLSLRGHADAEQIKNGITGGRFTDKEIEEFMAQFGKTNKELQDEKDTYDKAKEDAEKDLENIKDTTDGLDKEVLVPSEDDKQNVVDPTEENNNGSNNGGSNNGGGNDNNGGNNNGGSNNGGSNNGGSNNGSNSGSGQAELPETGESSSYAIFGAAALAVLAGVGLVAPSFKKEN
ncbi:LPXTG cell wall anchor domain-containing protein [Ruoffia tabacinasalis]|uniref:LPXTG cell wall anchor domain-containing protein n=1 Tax=Ruoffia tabacinasalis TaxID=87458 RepID=UPI003F991740